VTLHFQRKYGLRDDNIIELEFEKTFSKIIFYAKKRYVGWKWVLTRTTDVKNALLAVECRPSVVEKRGRCDNDDEARLLERARTHAMDALRGQSMERFSEPDASGMETERRDSCLVVSRGVKRVVELLLADDTSRATALDRVCAYIVDELVAPVTANTVSWHELVQSKQFRMRPEEYRDRGQAPPIHILLAERLERRLGAGAPGTYQPGDRIQFVVVAQRVPGQKTSECGEDPDYAWHSRLPLSIEHYIERQIHGTMVRVLEPILLPSRRRTLDDVGLVSGHVDEETTEQQKKARAKEAQRLYTAHISRRKHEHQRQVGRGKRGLDALAVEEARCRLCGVVGESVCSWHTADERSQLVSNQQSKRQRVADDRQRVWRTCTACTQGWRAEDDAERASALPSFDIEDTIEATISCKNVTCEVYWQRRMVDRRYADE